MRQTGGFGPRIKNHSFSVPSNGTCVSKHAGTMYSNTETDTPVMSDSIVLKVAMAQRQSEAGYGRARIDTDSRR